MKQYEEGSKTVKENVVKVGLTKENHIGNIAKLMNDVSFNMSEKEGFDEKNLLHVGKRTVVEDRLEKLKLQKEVNGQVSDGYRAGHENRSSLTNVRGYGRGRNVCFD